MDTIATTPLCKRHHFAVDREHSRRASVLLLCPPVRPSAILRAVAEIVVYSIQGISGRPLPHVGIEVVERKPAIAEGYSPAAIAMKVWGFRVAASCEHGLPRQVFRGAIHTVTVLACAMALSAPTGLSASCPDAASNDRLNGSAITAAQAVPRHVGHFALKHNKVPGLEPYGQTYTPLYHAKTLSEQERCPRSMSLMYAADSPSCRAVSRKEIPA